MCMNKNAIIDQLEWLPGENKRTLPLSEAKIVFHLFDCMDTFVGEKSGILKKVAAAGKPVDGNTLRKKVRDYWYDNTELIDAFIQSEHSKKLTTEQKDVLIGWKKRIKGRFMCLKYYAKHAIFRPLEENNDSHYAVIGLMDDFETVIPNFKPLYIATTALLPYKSVIIWDGLIGLTPVYFGKGIRTTFLQDYQQAKKKNQIISNFSSLACTASPSVLNFENSF